VAQLGSQLSKAENRKIARKETAYEYSREDIYRDLLFHGRDLEGIKQVLGCDEKGLSVELKCAPSPRLWQKSTLWDQWILDPLVADALLQSLVLWSRQNHGAPCLPVGIEKWEIFAEELGDSVVAHLEIISVKHQKLTASIEIFSHDGVLLSRADGVAMMIEPSLQQAYSQRRFREEDAQLGVDRVWQ
jgi:hypothetical protein